jgi:predicted negative regulator of RcsB-dependent stress response
MDNSTLYDEQLMRYVDGEMSDTEKAEFEKRLVSDRSLQESVENLLLSKEAVRSYGIKEKVAGIHQQMMKELKTETPVKSISSFRRIIRYSVGVAASILLIFIGIEGYNFYNLSSDRLFTENYTSYDLITTRDGEDINETKIEKAYRNKDYNQVIKLNGNSILTQKDIFLTGMAYLETGDAARAASSFQVALIDMKEDENSVLKDAAEYYLALAYLKNRDYDQAIDMMNAIHNNPSHLYKDKFSGKYINRVKWLKWR